MKAGRRGGFLALSCALMLLFASGALGDVLHMKDGRTVEGKMLEETKDKVRIKTRVGVLEFKIADIERIERKKSDVEVFDERFAAAFIAAMSPACRAATRRRRSLSAGPTTPSAGFRMPWRRSVGPPSSLRTSSMPGTIGGPPRSRWATRRRRTR